MMRDFHDLPGGHLIEAIFFGYDTENDRAAKAVVAYLYNYRRIDLREDWHKVAQLIRDVKSIPQKCTESLH